MFYPRLCICILIALAILRTADGPAAESSYDPQSVHTAPCGRGTPPPGHASPEITSPGVVIDLTVRQDGNHLCYVNNGIADAPIIHTRLGTDLVIHLRNEITDPQAIDAVSGPGKLTSANAAVPASPEYFAVTPGMHHEASGATNLHVHGFAVPPMRPQDEVLVTCTDPATGSAHCGQRDFTYRYRVPADMPEGLYWYHPHVHGEVQAQMLMGLTGALIVEGPLSDARRLSGIVERVLIVRQTQDLDAAHAQPAAMTAAAIETSGPSTSVTQVASKVDTAHELLCTRNAGIDIISLNGTPIPLGLADDSAYAHYSIAAGSRQLWRVLNAATDAFLSLAVIDENGMPSPIQIVALDGAPLTDDSGALLAGAIRASRNWCRPQGALRRW